MRSLEEWLQYVEQQAEAARRRRSGAAENSPEEAPAPSAAPEQASASEAAAQVARNKRAARSTPTGSPAPEGRALLTWEDTSPLQKPASTTPPPFSPPAQDRLAPASENLQNPPEGLGLVDPSESPTAEERAAEAASAATASPTSVPELETGVEPLKPYQPRDPRWRSSVAPPRLRVEPVSTRDGTPPLISAPARPEEKNEEKAKRDESPLLDPSLAHGAAGSNGTTAPASDPAVLPSAPAVSPTTGATAPVSASPPVTDAAPVSPPEKAAPVKRARRLTAKKAETAPPPVPETPEQLQALWDRVPRHVQSLIRTQNDEVAQRSYKSFRESREDLISRLLDPELSLEEAARILAVCPTTVRRYTNRGLLAHHRTPGNQRRFRLSHVLEFMERYGATLSKDQVSDGTEGADGGKPEASRSPSERASGERNDPALQDRPS